MFKKKEREIESERANLALERLEGCKKALDLIDTQNKDLRVELDQVGMSATRMDNCLTKVVDHAKQTLVLEKQNDESLDNLMERIELMRQEDTANQEDYDKLSERFTSQRDSLLNLMDQSKHYTNLTKKLTEATSGYKDICEQILTKTEEMKGYASTMSVMSLNCAIEAGRLGDSGLEYVKAAEEIRGYSEKYNESVSWVEEEMKALRRSYDITEQQVHQLIVLLKENNVLLNKLAKNSDVQVSYIQENPAADLQEAFISMHQVMELMQKNAKEVLMEQHAVLGEMESVGSCFMEEQQSVSKMERCTQSISQAVTIASKEKMNLTDDENETVVL